MDKLIVDFCEYFGDPENELFIKKKLPQTMVIRPDVVGCQISFHPLVHKFEPNKSLDAKKLKLTGAAYGACIALGFCALLMAVYVVGNKYMKNRNKLFGYRMTVE